MYKCLDCNEVFEEPITIQENESLPYTTPYYVEVEACPECASTNFVISDMLTERQTERLSGNHEWVPIEFNELTKYCLFRMRDRVTNEYVTSENGQTVCIALSCVHIIDGEECVDIDWIDNNII